MKAWVESWVPIENVSIRKSEGLSDRPAEGPGRADLEVTVLGSDPGLQGRECHPQWNILQEHLVFGLHSQMRKLGPRRGNYLPKLRAKN